MDRTEQPSFVLPIEEPAEPAAPRDSATVIVVRDGAAGLETFMLERHLNSDVLGGAYVFPGGTVSPGDRDPALADVFDGIGEDHVRALGDDAVPLLACAIRETFEEAGILLARHRDGSPVTLEDPRWNDLRDRLNARAITALELAREAGIVFAADLLRYWHRLCTPVQAPKRYDARFFIAVMPAGQEPLHDDLETTASVWVSPDDAVARGRAGTLSIIYPTRKTLESIGRYPTASALFAAAHGRAPDAITPRVVMKDGEARIELPDGTIDLP
jgi:8-oxo-dGTP pyrophosphatase MutT (NUDIX family)